MFLGYKFVALVISPLHSTDKPIRYNQYNCKSDKILYAAKYIKYSTAKKFESEKDSARYIVDH